MDASRGIAIANSCSCSDACSSTAVSTFDGWSTAHIAVLPGPVIGRNIFWAWLNTVTTLIINTTSDFNILLELARRTHSVAVRCEVVATWPLINSRLPLCLSTAIELHGVNYSWRSAPLKPPTRVLSAVELHEVDRWYIDVTARRECDDDKQCPLTI